jgi:TonB family protein
MSSPSPDQSPAKPNSTTLASQSSKAAPAVSSGNANPGAGTGAAATRTAENAAPNPETSGLKSDPAPMVVKSGRAARNAPPKASDRASDGANSKDKDDESEPLLALASSNDGKLSGLMSSVSSTVSKPSLGTLKISQGVSQGLLIKRVNPIYPKMALSTHLEGAVLIDATINKDGNVTNTKVVSGTPVLAQAALDAVRQWRYKPYYLDGTPVDIQTQITVNFKARR